VGSLHVGSPCGFSASATGDDVRALSHLLEVICCNLRLPISTQYCGAHIPIWSCLQNRHFTANDLAMRMAIRSACFPICARVAWRLGKCSNPSWSQNCLIPSAGTEDRGAVNGLSGFRESRMQHNISVRSWKALCSWLCSYEVVCSRSFFSRGRTTPKLQSLHESWSSVGKTRQLNTRPRDGVWAFACLSSRVSPIMSRVHCRKPPTK
jgi:hypothetical protein